MLRHAKAQPPNRRKPPSNPSVGRRGDQSDRRWRSRGAARQRGQGTGGKRHRCRRAADRSGDCGWRQDADPGHRRRLWHGARRSAAGTDPSRDVQNRRHRPAEYPHIRLSRRGIAQLGGGWAPDDHHSRRRRRTVPGSRSLAAAGRGETGGAERRHRGRAARYLSRHPGAAEIPAHGPGRGAGDRRCGQAAGDGRALCGLHSARCVRGGEGR